MFGIRECRIRRQKETEEKEKKKKVGKPIGDPVGRRDAPIRWLYQRGTIMLKLISAISGLLHARRPRSQLCPLVTPPQCSNIVQCTMFNCKLQWPDLHVHVQAATSMGGGGGGGAYVLRLRGIFVQGELCPYSWTGDLTCKCTAYYSIGRRRHPTTHATCTCK